MENNVIARHQDIHFADMGLQFKAEQSQILELLKQTFAKGDFVNGEAIELLEQELAAYCQVQHAVTLNSGTDALIFGMKALGIGAGDEVITPPNSFIASTSSIVHIGATPVFVDVARDQNIDVALIENAITPRTKAIMPVHLTGRMANMTKLQELAKKYNLYLIEDAAQAFGSKYDSKLSGSCSDIGCFSTHPLKVLNAAGDGGFLLTNNAEVAAKVRILRNHGLLDRDTVSEWGYVSRMDTIQAQLLRFRLKDVDRYVNVRRNNVAIYRKLITTDQVYIPPCQEVEYNSFQTFVIQVKNRNKLQQYLAEQRVFTKVHYPIPIHLQPVAKSMGHMRGDFPVTEQLADEILTIPAHQYMTQEEVCYIAELINGFYDF